MTGEQPVIWLASFPRSGNTFLRNILYEVFGIESGTFDLNNGILLEPGYLNYRVIKTHMLPLQLIPQDPAFKAVYLVRDGRDAIVSIAHHRSDIVMPGSDFMTNMKAAIYAEKGTFFGGWSKNVTEWIERADLIIRYEDLIADPAGCAEKLRQLMNLSEGDYSKIPGFSKMKFGLPHYGSGRDRLMSEEEKRSLAERNFRKGKVGSWKEEMPGYLHDLFWSIHGDVMLKMGYHYDGTVDPIPDKQLSWKVVSKMVHPAAEESQQREKLRVLIEADKLTSPVNDGVKRYQVMLLKELLNVHQNPAGRWHFDLYANGHIAPLTDFSHLILEPFLSDSDDKHGTTTPKLKAPVTVKIQQWMLRAIPAGLKDKLSRNRIMIFHRLFDLFWASFHYLAAKARGVVRWIASRYRRLVLLFTADRQALADAGPDALPDLIHLPLQQHYLPFSRARSPVLVTLHDFTHRLMPNFHTPLNIRNAERGWRFAMKRAAACIAVSGATAEDAEKFGGADCPPITVIHEAADRAVFHHQVNSEDRHLICRKYLIPEKEPFLFTLSSIEPRKNLENIIKGFFELLARDSNIKLNLVVGGREAWGTFHPHKLNGFDPERVIFTGFIDDDDLQAIYSEALAFCYVSHYEGFGLPLLEAMNCGTPVIYGNNSSMPEVAGNAGLPANASDFRDIADQMSNIFYDEGLRKEMRAAALRQAAEFSTLRMAQKTLEMYQKTINNVRQKT